MGPHETELCLRYDGRIPAIELEAARELDRAERASRPRVARTKTKPVRLTAAGVVASMAQALLNAYAAKGDATEDDMVAAGFSRKQIADFGPHARAQAKRLFVKRPDAPERQAEGAPA